MINGQYWINTDQFIDIERLKSIELDIIKGICMTVPHHHKIAVYGFTVLEKPNWASVDHLLHHVYKDKYAKTYNELWTEIKDITQRMEAVKLFTKLAFGVYSGGVNVVLRRESDYTLKNHSQHCKDTVASLCFPSLMSYLDSLPFSEVGRAVIFLNDHDLGTPIHTDGFPGGKHTNDFLWLSTNLSKKFFIYDKTTCTKHYVASHSAFFNEHDWHGSDGVSEMNFSIRVDGVFTPEFKDQLGISHLTDYNA